MKTGKNELAPRTVQLHVYARFRERTVYAKVAVIGEAYVADGAAVELALVWERTGEVIGTRRIPDLLRKGRKEVTFSIGRVGSGNCSFQAVLIDRHGTRMPVRVLQEKSRGNIPWLGCDTGVSREVPAPWTPMRSRRTQAGAGLAVSCWGRTYEFDELHFVKQIVSKEKPVLAAPMRLLATVNGRNVRWQTGTLTPVAREDGEVVFTRNFSSGPLRVNALTRVDFDGMMRVDWSLATSKPVTLNALVMEIIIPAEHAKYLYHFPGSWGSAKNVGSLPAQDVTLPFRPFIWLGDEERGLAWFAESDLNWFKGDPDRVTEITRKDNLVTLRLRLVSKPVRLVPAGGSGVEMTGFGQESGFFRFRSFSCCALCLCRRLLGGLRRSLSSGRGSRAARLRPCRARSPQPPNSELLSAVSVCNLATTESATCSIETMMRSSISREQQKSDGTSAVGSRI